MAWEVIAAQRLYYPSSPSAASSILLMFSSQLIGKICMTECTALILQTMQATVSRDTFEKS